MEDSWNRKMLVIMDVLTHWRPVEWAKGLLVADGMVFLREGEDPNMTVTEGEEGNWW